MTDLDREIPRGQTVLPPIVQVHFDGACEPARGGGIATYGFTVEGGGFEHDESGLAVRPWSPRATNNVAEYTAAIRALEWLRHRGFSGHVILIGDSQLVIRQMTGEYAVKAEHLRAYWERLRSLASGFTEVQFVWVPREENTKADALSKEAMVAAQADAGRHRPEHPEPPVQDDIPPDAD